jgi:hypothetical protein
MEIIESHESKEIRELALKCLKEKLPEKKQEIIVEIWISHPTPSLRGYVTELVHRGTISKPLLSASLVMLDEWEELQKVDKDYKHLDTYLKNLDPLLGSLLFDRVTKLKTPELGESLLHQIHQDSEADQSILDLIRKKNYAALWENILEYPLPFICELFKIFNQENWVPIDKSSYEIFETLMEMLGVDGWYGVEHIKWLIISKQKEKKFLPLEKTEIRRRIFDLHISTDLITRPDRLTAQKFKARGTYNLTDTQLGIHIYQNMIRKSDLDGLLHIPIYGNNGAELAEFVIPAPSTGNFQMDEDGMYFTVRNKNGLYSVDIDSLAAILLPVKSHSEAINEIIPSLLEKASDQSKMVLEALNLLSTLHRGREYTLWDLKKDSKWEEAIEEYQTCECTISIDLGNTSTKVALVIGSKCGHKSQTWKIPSIIHYFSPENYIVGNEVITKKLENSSQTFKNWKLGLKPGNQSYIRIHNTIIYAQTAFQNFLTRMIKKITTDIGYEISSIALAFSLDAPAGFENWLREAITSFNFKRVSFIDECTASVVGSYRLQNQRGNILLIDFGSSQTSAIIASLPLPKSRKRKEEARMQEDYFQEPQIIARTSVAKGSSEITKMLLELSFNENERQSLAPRVWNLMEETKKNLAFDFEYEIELPNYEILKYSLNEKVEDDFIHVLHEFENSDIFYSFKLLIRNILAKSTQRGIDKPKIDTVLLTGHGLNWPPFLKYLVEIFPNKEIIIEDDIFLAAKGIGVIANNQNLDFVVENDLMLKIVNDGIIGYEPILRRGERGAGIYKTYEIRPQARFDKIVIDCWIRKPRFILDENTLPLNDNERTEYRRDDNEIFTYERIYRGLARIDIDSQLQVIISDQGSLSFHIKQSEGIEVLNAQSTVY